MADDRVQVQSEIPVKIRRRARDKMIEGPAQNKGEEPPKPEEDEEQEDG